ncbi:hypothetical protein hp2017_0946 [Helicobacter pylori 2017]|nr:hypothetical protein hp2017_0946 [Helicobacter pylori 2017]
MRQASDNPLKRSSWVRGILRGLRGRVISKYPPIPLRE